MNLLLTNILSVSGIEYLIINKNFRILEMSLGLNRFADIPEQVRRDGDVRIVFPELEGLEDIFDAIQQGEQSSFELKGISRSPDSTSPLYIDICITKNIQEDNYSNSFIILVQNVTQQMVLEQSLFQGANEANLLLRNLKASKQYIDQIVTSIPDALLVTTLSGNIKKVNPAAQVLLEYDETELIGQPIAKVIKEVNQHNIQSIDISRKLEINYLVKDIETVCHTKSDKTININFSCSIIKTEIEHFQGYVYILRDMTERKQAELAKQQFLAMISHEVRTPITSVTGMANLLLDSELTLEQRDFVETIYTSGNFLLKIINDFLDFSKVQSGNLELEEQPFILRNCINQALDLLAPKAKEKGLKITFIDNHKLPTTIVGDITRLRQVLINLLSNAIKFTNNGNIEVSVTARKQTDNNYFAVNTYEIQFSIKDKGIGIPRDRLERLFKAFSQVNSSITREYGGTGLGLAICKQLCELMGGRIWVESQLNTGSTFYFTITASVIPEEVGLKSSQYNLGLSRHFLQRGEPAVDPPIGEVLIPLSCHPSGVYGGSLSTNATDNSIAHSGYPSGATGVKNSELRIQESEVKNYENNCNISALDSSKLRILLTEDNLVNQKIALKQLKNLGYSADIANNGQEALEILEKIPYDLILMDCQMPILDGLEATKEIHRWQESRFASGRRPVVIAMTANAMKEDKQMCLDAGMDDYLSKPVLKEDLVVVLEHWATIILNGKETDLTLVELSIDWERLHQLSENNPEFEIELLQIFVEDIQVRLEIIKMAIATHNFKQLAREAHQIKGASANMGITTMHLAAEKLEQLARNQERRGTNNIISELEEFVKHIQDFLIKR
ncbi:PAS domain-containing hybrid sensor histidine kinase/response regulator [Nostoc sp. PA-18-2419]|uniref:PAS domain-containing hybrid sensor histidine kinase/response regulator n=1 Tax=Nostoc sp. PA-18-2419 TaxID=2575443 RepID=UPI00294FF308|nr:ATP-binding protein [Nostoc sp. PA-18-2419]